MGRPRVIVAARDAKRALALVAALNPKRYRVEPAEDPTVALLRTKLVLAHVLLIDVPDLDEGWLREFRGVHGRTTLVLYTENEKLAAAVSELEARTLPDGYTATQVKRAVYRAVARTDERRNAVRPPELTSRNRILVIAETIAAGEVLAAVLRSQLHIACEVVGDATRAAEYLEAGAACLLAPSGTFTASPAGARLAASLARSGVPVIALPQGRTQETSSAGALAWELVPKVRQCLRPGGVRAEGVRPGGLEPASGDPEGELGESHERSRRGLSETLAS